MDNEGEIEVIPGLNGPEEPEAQAETTQAEPAVTETPEPEKKEAEKYVPLAALHEERQRRKEMMAEVERLRRDHNELMERLKPKPEPPPDITVDPVTNIDQRLRAQEEYRQQLERQQLEQQESSQRAQQEQQFLATYHGVAQEFSAKTPDFMPAYQFLMKSREDELVASGVDAQTAKSMITSEEVFLVSQAFNQGANPAERIYKLAKARGFKQQVSGDDKIATIEKGQQAKSLSGGGTTPKEPDSYEALNEITDDAEFLKAFRKMAS